MMPPNISSSVSPTPATPSTPMPVIVAAVFDDNVLTHADYDLHPLAVRSLDHYVARDEEGERFHIR